jgi:hypothetical protein
MGMAVKIVTLSYFQQKPGRILNKYETPFIVQSSLDELEK